MERKRLLHQLETPYSTVRWPQVLPEDQDTVLELLCNLLSTLGDYRRAHLVPSQGKRSKRRKKKLADKQISDLKSSMPPPPELFSFVDIGLASITRRLQQDSGSPIIGSNGDHESSENLKKTPYTMILVARSGHSSAFHSHFPQIVAMASQSCPDQPAIRLVGFSKSCEDRLSDCLGVPRVSAVALRTGAPFSGPLLDFVRQKVPPIEISWIKELATEYQQTKIRTVEAPVGPKKQRVNPPKIG